jgi:superfamily II DNA/RNA helicase
LVVCSEDNQVHKGPTVLILAPTESACDEIFQIVKKYSTNTKITSFQLRTSSENFVEIMITTPETLVDHILGKCQLKCGMTVLPFIFCCHLTDKQLELSDCSLIIFDEIDEMLLKGEHRNIEQLFKSIKHFPQLLVFSSFWTLDVRIFMQMHFSANKYEYIRMVQ